MLLLPIDILLRQARAFSRGCLRRCKGCRLQAWFRSRGCSTLPGLILSLGIILLALAAPLAVSAQDPAATPSESPTPLAPPFITFPRKGDAVQGSVEITGSTDIQGFQSFTLDFAYPDDQTRTWFEIESSGQNVAGGILARWDTRQISDGDYRLRLRVFSAGNEPKRFIVDDVRIRNYTPLDTATPTDTPTVTSTALPTATTTLMPTQTATPHPTPSPLPRNPAEVTSGQIVANGAQGAVAAIALFAIFGLFIRLRRR
jgi:hypothetical protein